MNPISGTKTKELSTSNSQKLPEIPQEIKDIQQKNPGSTISRDTSDPNFFFLNESGGRTIGTQRIGDQFKSAADKPTSIPDTFNKEQILGPSGTGETLYKDLNYKLEGNQTII